MASGRSEDVDPFLLFWMAMQTIASGRLQDSAGPPTVETRMSRPAITVRPEASLGEVLRHVLDRRITGVPVVYEDERLVGVVTTSDLLALPDPTTSDRIASDVMSPAVVTARPEARLDATVWRMVAGRVHRVVVVDRSEHVLGVLSPSDAIGDLIAGRIELPLERVMSSPVKTVPASAPVDSATRELALANVHGLVVVAGETPIGVFTHLEALAWMAKPASLRPRTVEDAMSYEMVCLDVATPLGRAAAYLDAMQVRRLVVVRDQKLVGVVSALELAGVLARAQAQAPTDEP